MHIVKADQSHINEVARLFDLYRQFYACDPDLALATRFISERITMEESVIFLALDGETGCGFLQLYPSFCSVEATKIFILYDLYIDASCRRTGLGERLMRHTTNWAAKQGATRLDLLTAKDNFSAQRLYEKLGYTRVLDDFYAYSLADLQSC